MDKKTSVKPLSEEKNPINFLQESGFIGAVEGNKTDSIDYKRHLYMKKKTRRQGD